MFAQYVQTVRLLFRDAYGLDLEEVFPDLAEASDQLRRAYEAGISEQAACERLLELLSQS